MIKDKEISSYQNVKKMNGEVKKLGSIRFKVLVLPILLVATAITSIALLSYYFTGTNMRELLKADGLILSEQLVTSINGNTDAINTIMPLVDTEIEAVALLIAAVEDTLSNDILNDIAKELKVGAIIVYDLDGVVKYASSNDYIEMNIPKEHIVYEVARGDQTFVLEDIRANIITGEQFKNGYLKTDRYIIQVGLYAEIISELTRRFEYQAIVTEFAQSEGIVYTTITDKESTVLASTIPNSIGTKVDTEIVADVVRTNTPHKMRSHFELINETIVHIHYPLTIDGEIVGTTIIGFYLTNVNNAISSSVSTILIGGAIAILILAFLLFINAHEITSSIRIINHQLTSIASGDLLVPLPDSLLNKNNELGKMAHSVTEMKESLVFLIQTLNHRLNTLSDAAQMLTTTTKQVSYSSKEVTNAITQIASGAVTQSEEAVAGRNSLSDLDKLIKENNRFVQELHDTQNYIEKVVKEGYLIIDALVDQTIQNNVAANDVTEIIYNTNESVKKIANASSQIKNISAQTNLLALNATIEAARAGEFGRGFTVVAAEIRKLADESIILSQQISSIIDELTSKTSYAVDSMAKVQAIVAEQSSHVNKTNEKFNGIKTAIDGMKEIDNKLTYSSDHMNNQKDSMIQIIDNLAAISEENSASTEETSASVQQQDAALEEISETSTSLSNISVEIAKIIEKYKL